MNLFKLSILMLDLILNDKKSIVEVKKSNLLIKDLWFLISLKIFFLVYPRHNKNNIGIK